MSSPQQIPRKQKLHSHPFCKQNLQAIPNFCAQITTILLPTRYAQLDTTEYCRINFNIYLAFTQGIAPRFWKNVARILAFAKICHKSTSFLTQRHVPQTIFFVTKNDNPSRTITRTTAASTAQRKTNILLLGRFARIRGQFQPQPKQRLFEISHRRNAQETTFIRNFHRHNAQEKTFIRNFPPPQRQKKHLFGISHHSNAQETTFIRNFPPPQRAKKTNATATGCVRFIPNKVNDLLFPAKNENGLQGQNYPGILINLMKSCFAG